MSDLKISAGYNTIEEEFEDSLRRSFVNNFADYIVIYDKRHRFLFESAAYGERLGWLSSEFVELDEQSSEMRYRLTEAGKKHFGL